MLDSLQFVQGAVAKKDFLPALTHYRIQDGGVMAYNGIVALYSPIAVDLSFNPNAQTMIKVIEQCGDNTPSFSLTESGRLCVKAGTMKAFVDCAVESFVPVEPEGTRIAIPPGTGLLQAVKILSPFISKDASRPWSRGIILRGHSAYATNNILLLERWLGVPFPYEITIPVQAVEEMLRIGVEPTQATISATSATFHYNGGRWLRTALLLQEPPPFSRILEKACSPKVIAKSIFVDVRRLAPFVGDLGGLYFRPGLITTHINNDLVGVTLNNNEVDFTGHYHAKQFLLLDGVATDADFSVAPVLFYGDRLRGALIGMRDEV